jgi:hypothetical protein
VRTTINIDDDTLDRVRREADRTRSSLTATINRVLALGLRRIHPQSRRKPYRCPVISMGFPPRPILDKALALADRLEDEHTTGELELRK